MTDGTGRTPPDGELVEGTVPLRNRCVADLTTPLARVVWLDAAAAPAEN